ncbi:Phosphomethylpyrimidine kinase type-1 [Metarhizium guizhouense ARSEF 977]|uniref:Phosphomethylpyrimidine kinase type-1 n=1 Tax=Metarhizium guizhouense (strain ARSEF 977) TaxID=1276136 RepID=A0A0B4H2J6_METGA|nr:Phosphomethylpyrimidine kinase type-1 [Metarhizium guizhouense ARSEF 977]
MESPQVLVLGCFDDLPNAGLKTDQKVLATLQMPCKVISTGSNSKRCHVQTEPKEALLAELRSALQNSDCNVVKIGAMPSIASVQAISDIWRQWPRTASVLDMEPFFKTGQEIPNGMLVALIEHVLPSITILSATVGQVMALLEGASIEASYPTGIQGIVALGKKLQSLGPRYVIVKREMFDEPEQTTTLHFVLCGDGEPVVERLRCENPKGVFGVSYSILSAIAASLAKGRTRPDAVVAGFRFAQEMLQKGSYFD